MTYLLTEAELKVITPTAEGVNQKDYLPALRLVQETEVRPVLGTELYDELLAQVAAGTVTALNEALLVRIRPFMAWATYKQLRRDVWARTVTAGVTHSQAPQFTMVSKQTLDWATQQDRERANGYRNELVGFLNDNQRDYPLWKCHGAEKASPWMRTI